MTTQLDHCFTVSIQRALRFLLGLALLAGVGCASLPQDYDKPVSRALSNPQETALGADIAKVAARHPGMSGFSLLRYGRNALNLRLALTNMAQRTLDVQVYIWETDVTGQIFAKHLLAAADRGVRVRMLIDDLGLKSSDEHVAALDAHPNIEVRVFNPFANRDSQMLDFIFDFKRVNSRMHNKTFIVDNAAAIVGGRNVGDHYFAINPDSNFRDLDIGAIGPIAKDVSSVFDHFWNGDWAVPISELAQHPPTESDVQDFHAMLREHIDPNTYAEAVQRTEDYFWEELATGSGQFTWSHGQIVWDNPDQQASPENPNSTGDITLRLQRKVSDIERSLDIESAYFVIGAGSVETIRTLVDRGVQVRVLTNSLASNDVLAAHAGHALYRKAILEAGAQLYELRPDSNVIKTAWKGESRAGLHTKAFVFDARSVFIGSYNLDPRSANINTEAGLYVESEALAAQLLEYMAEGKAPDSAYRLDLNERDKLVWTSNEGGIEKSYDVDPLSTWGQRVMSWFIGLLPIESQL